MKRFNFLEQGFLKEAAQRRVPRLPSKTQADVAKAIEEAFNSEMMRQTH